MPSSPRISIIMAVRDGARFLGLTLDSLRRQSLRDFELIAVDDGSQDATGAILDACHDFEIVKLRNETSLGLARSLNKGIAAARGAYIARQDADDLSYPERLTRQAAFMDSHPDVVLLGTAYDVIDQSGKRLETQRQPQDDRGIRWQMLFHNAFCHSSVMLRKSVLDNRGLSYDESLSFAQDYDFWSRLMRHGKAANLTEPLLALRQHESSMSAQGRSEQQALAGAVAARNMARLLGVEPDDKAVRYLRAWYYGLPDSLAPEGVTALSQVLRLIKAFGPCGQEGVWAQRLLRHPDLPIGRFLPELLGLAPLASTRALLQRLLGRTATQPNKARPLDL
jgi:hypothetical protein